MKRAAALLALALTGCSWLRAHPGVAEAGANAVGDRAEIVCALAGNARDRAVCVLAVRVAAALAADAARIATEAALEGQACPAPSAAP